ncbi:hypothetical protein Pelo_10734 [Pelomyxa schiedti]|nr:hypothetical protein Pelo_10734 [Pelomyxa schiedti]
MVTLSATVGALVTLSWFIALAVGETTELWELTKTHKGKGCNGMLIEVLAWKMVAADDACETTPCEDSDDGMYSSEVWCTDAPSVPSDEGIVTELWPGKRRCRGEATGIIWNTANCVDGYTQYCNDVSVEVWNCPLCGRKCTKIWPGDDGPNQEGEYDGQPDDLDYMEDIKLGECFEFDFGDEDDTACPAMIVECKSRWEPSPEDRKTAQAEAERRARHNSMQREL